MSLPGTAIETVLACGIRRCGHRLHHPLPLLRSGNSAANSDGRAALAAPRASMLPWKENLPSELPSKLGLLSMPMSAPKLEEISVGEAVLHALLPLSAEHQVMVASRHQIRNPFRRTDYLLHSPYRRLITSSVGAGSDKGAGHAGAGAGAASR